MRLCFYLLTSVFLLALAPVVAQKEPMKFGKISPEELAMKVYEPDTAAAAVILGDYGQVKFENPTYLFTRHKRIKIFKRAGFEEGDIEIRYYGKPKDRVIDNLKAKVFLPDGTEVDVPKADFFTEEVTDFLTSVRFTFPKLEEGAIIEYRYDYTLGYFSLPDWYFQSHIPTRWSELRLEIPEYFEYVFFTQGPPFDIFERPEPRSNMLSTGLNKMVMKDVPALKKEAFITTMEDYFAHVRFQLKSLFIPGSIVEDVIPDWFDLAENLVKDESFGLQYLKKRNYDKAWEAVQPALAKAATPKEKVETLYQFVVSNIDINDNYGIYVQKSLNDCFEKKSARPNEANLLLVALLNEAGIDAHPVMISTRDNGLPMTVYPLVQQFDHVMAVATVDSAQVLLDAKNPFRPAGYPAIKSLNREGWVVIKDSPQWMEIAPKQGSDTYLMNFSLDETGALHGSLTMSADGYSAISDRVELHEKPSGEHFKMHLTTLFPDIKIDSMRFENQENLLKPLKSFVNCHLSDMAQVSGDFIYLTPAITSDYRENPFKLAQRTYPVDIPYPFKEQIILNLAIPAGYVVEGLPEPLLMSLPENAAKFQYQFSQRGSSLQLISNLQMNRLRFEPEEYDSLRNFFNLIAEKMGEQVVLKKG